MENSEEVLHSLEEFSRLKPKDIPRELEDYLCYVAKTGDPVYQWSSIKSLFREKLVNVITDFYETCPSVDIPPCPNVDIFNYDNMKSFILEKLDTFAAAPFTVQRISELLTTPRKEYNRIDKYMRALERNILVVSTIEPGGRRSTTENGESVMNGLESEHAPEMNSGSDVDVEMEETQVWSRSTQNETVTVFTMTETAINSIPDSTPDVKMPEAYFTSSADPVITTCCPSEEPYVSINPVPSETCSKKDQDNMLESDVSVTITAIPAEVQKRINNIKRILTSASMEGNETNNSEIDKIPEMEKQEEIVSSGEIIADSSQICNEETIIDCKVDDLNNDLIRSSTEEDISIGSKIEVITEEIIEQTDEKIEDEIEEVPLISGEITCSDSKIEEVVTVCDVIVDDEITSSVTNELHSSSSSETENGCEETTNENNEAQSIEIEEENNVCRINELQQENKIEANSNDDKKLNNLVEVTPTKSDEDNNENVPESTADSSELPL